MIDRIKAHYSREEKGNKDKDQTLIGLLKTGTKLLENDGVSVSMIKVADEHGLMSELFNKCLFPDNITPPTEDITAQTDKSKILIAGNKCQTEESRKCAFSLLWKLCKNSPRLLNDILKRGMEPLIAEDKFKRQPGWNYLPSSDTKSNSYLGIKNLGCICYMISMLQQFYNIPAFRYLMLRAPDTEEDNMQEYKGHMINDKLIYQFQKMLSSLELSDRSSYNPFEFCFAFKEMDGSPTKVGEQ